MGVTPIHNGIILSESKQTLLDTVADSYDELSGRNSEPVCVVYAFVTETGETVTGYHTISKISDRNTLHIARAIMCLNSDHQGWIE